MKIEKEPTATALGGATPRDRGHPKIHLGVDFVLSSYGIIA
jgi:hypothetical protein